MATYEALRQAIDTLIKANGNKEITGDILNNVLNTMLTALSANYQFCGEAKPNTAPGQPLQNVFYFAYEAGTYVNFGGITLPLGISMLKWDGTAWTGENIYTFDAQPLLNSSNLISSGAVYNALIELSDAMHSGKLFAGIADPSTTPDGLTNGQPIFYLAVEKGTYSHFFANGDIPLVLEKDGIWILTSGADDDDWNAVCLIEIDDTPNPLSNELISSKAVYNAIRLFGESFGFGKLYNGIATPTTTPDPLQGRRMFYLATQAGTYEHFFANGDIPLVLPHDGLYAIYSVTGSDDDDWNWEQILQFDDEVISNSHNLPTSMAVYNTLEAFKAEVNALIQDINPTVIEGNVTNAPDEEDLTSVNERLKFKNKEYNSLSASGLGRVYLRKNWVNGVNTLTQAMINEANTIYHIQYDYVLGEDITVPADCVLEFDGGSISGEHTITGQNTCINAGLVKIFGTDVTLAGTWNVLEAYPEWFGAIGDGTTDDTLPVKKAARFALYSGLLLNLLKKYRVIGNNIFGNIDNQTWHSVIIKGTGKIAWLPNTQTDILFNLSNYVWNFEIAGIEISVITDNVSASSAGIVFSLSNSGGISSNDLNLLENVGVAGSSTTDIIYKIFDVSGYANCDKTKCTCCHFYRFDYLLDNNNYEAVGWIFDNCEIWPGQDKIGSTLFRYQKVSDFLQVRNCHLILMEGTNLITVSSTSTNNTARFIFENNRLEGRLITNHTTAENSTLIHLNSGKLVMRSNTFRNSKGSLIPLNIKFTGSGCGIFEEVVFPNTVNLYTKLYDTQPYSMYKHEYHHCKFSNYPTYYIIDSNNDVIPYEEASFTLFYEGLLVKDCFTDNDIYNSIIVCNNGSAYQPRLTFTKGFSQNYVPIGEIAIPANQMITKIELLIGDVSAVISNPIKAVAIFDTDYQIEKAITYNSAHAQIVTLFEGIMYKYSGLPIVKVYLENANGDKTTRNCMITVYYTSPLGEACLKHVSAENPRYVLPTN